MDLLLPCLMMIHPQAVCDIYGKTLISSILEGVVEDVPSLSKKKRSRLIPYLLKRL